MSALAQILSSEGAYVQGSDVAENDETEKLKEKGVTVFHGHQKQHIKNVDIVVYSSAIHDDNEELVEAKNCGIKILKRAELLGMVASLYDIVIAVAGSHGKTTTSAMIAEIFLKAGLNPTFHIGGTLNKMQSNYHLGSKKIFITEACEYKDNFLYISPDIAVVLNIDSDHLDYFGSLDGVKKSFYRFVNGTQEGGILIMSADDKNSKELSDFENNSTFGFSRHSEMRAVNVKEYKPGYFSFDAEFMGCNLGNIKLNIIGKHNISNALVAILISIIFDIDLSDIRYALENFSGTKRRCEKIGELNGAVVFHDYAHHPKQIEKMILTAKELVKKNGRVISVFEPHTYSRTKFLLDDFAKSFDGCDISIFAPAYSARENKSDGYEADILANETKNYVKQVEYIQTFDEIFERLKILAQPNDVIFILGAGTIEHLAKMFEVSAKH